MKRYLLLALSDFLLLILLGSLFDVSEAAPLLWGLVTFLNPLVRPAEWAAAQWPAQGLLVVTTAFLAGPWLWAAIVELLLCRLVDRSRLAQEE